MSVLFAMLFGMRWSSAVTGRMRSALDGLRARNKGTQAFEKLVEHLAARKQLLDFQAYLGTLFCRQRKRTIITILRHVFCSSG